MPAKEYIIGLLHRQKMEAKRLKRPQYQGIYTEHPKPEIMNTQTTDFENFLDYLDDHRNHQFTGLVEMWKEWKSSHSVSEGGESKPDWEIVEIYFGDLKSKDALSIYDFKVKGSRHAHWNIHSVRRLSDGEVFSINDKVISDRWGEQIIIGFSYEFDSIRVDFKTCRNPLGSIQKAPEVKEPLFTTEDGKDVFDGDGWWSLFTNKNWDVMYNDPKEHTHNPDFKGLRFSTKEAADDFVNLNKPVLCVKDIHTILIQLSKVNDRDINKYDYNEQIKKSVFALAVSKIKQ